jgi:hypothetical protein
VKKVILYLINLETLDIFRKEFDTEFDRDKFIRKLKYSKKIKPLHTFM